MEKHKLGPLHVNRKNITELVSKRRLKFKEYLVSLDDNQFIKTIFTYIARLKQNTKGAKEVKYDTEEIGQSRGDPQQKSSRVESTT